MVNLIFADFRGLALAKLALGKVDSGNASSRRDQTTVKLHSAVKLIMGSSHETDREVRYEEDCQCRRSDAQGGLRLEQGIVGKTREGEC